MPPLEPDLLEWQQGIAWADHLLIIHPYWWGAMPTRAKGGSGPCPHPRIRLQVSPQGRGMGQAAYR